MNTSQAEQKEIERASRRVKKNRPTMKVSGRGTKKLAGQLAKRRKD